MKNYLLTDFNSEFKNIDIKNIQFELESLISKINGIGCLYGEITKPENFEINLSKVSHSIKNLTFIDNKIYGDVEFLKNDNGKLAENYVNNMKRGFSLRCLERNSNIVKIFTWDIADSNITGQSPSTL